MREIRQIGQYLKKSLYAGKTITATIKDVSQGELDKDSLDLHLLVDGQTDVVKMNCNAVDENTLIILYGPDETKWIGKHIKVEFSPIKNWVVNGSDRSGSTSKISKA